MRREFTRLSRRKEPMQKHGFLVMNCCVLLLLMAACLPPSAHAEDELFFAVSFEWTYSNPDKRGRYTTYKQTSYGAAWNFKSHEEAKIAARKECRRRARNPRNCQPAFTNSMKGICFVIVWAEPGGYGFYEIRNNESQKAYARSGRDDNGRPLSGKSRFVLMKCGQ